MGVESHPQDPGVSFKGQGSLSEGNVRVGLGLLSVGGEEGDGGLGLGYSQPPLVGPLSHTVSMGREGAGSSRDVGRGGGVRKVVSVRCTSQVRGGGVSRYVEVKKYGGDAGALRDSCVCVSVRGGGVVVSAAGHPTTKVGGQPAYRVVS